ncbi:MAG TPA: antitoxin [Dermatophilaceae bacterium]|nr:antitoxin [Dermatophilaceae bacterium]
MPDLLIRNFPADDLRRLDEQAARLGITRAELLRRRLTSEARRAPAQVTAADLRGLGAVLADLADDSVMTHAWS